MKTIKETDVKERLSILEKMELVNSVVDFADMTGEYDCRYLEVATVYYIGLNYLKDWYYDECPKTKTTTEEGKEIEVLDVFATYDKIKTDLISVKEEYNSIDAEGKSVVKTRTVKKKLWDYLSMSSDVLDLQYMIAERYDEVKRIKERQSSFESYLMSTIEELKVKFVETMDSINIDKLKDQQNDLPKLLESLTPEQKGLLDKLSILQGGKK